MKTVLSSVGAISSRDGVVLAPKSMFIGFWQLTVSSPLVCHGKQRGRHK